MKRKARPAPKRHNPVAKHLGVNRPQVIPSGKAYKRKAKHPKQDPQAAGSMKFLGRP